MPLFVKKKSTEKILTDLEERVRNEAPVYLSSVGMYRIIYDVLEKKIFKKESPAKRYKDVITGVLGTGKMNSADFSNLYHLNKVRENLERKNVEEKEYSEIRDNYFKDVRNIPRDMDLIIVVKDDYKDKKAEIRKSFAHDINDAFEKEAKPKFIEKGTKEFQGFDLNFDEDSITEEELIEILKFYDKMNTFLNGGENVDEQGVMKRFDECIIFKAPKELSVRDPKRSGFERIGQKSVRLMADISVESAYNTFYDRIFIYPAMKFTEIWNNFSVNAKSKVEDFRKSWNVPAPIDEHLRYTIRNYMKDIAESLRDKEIEEAVENIMPVLEEMERRTEKKKNGNGQKQSKITEEE